MREKEKVRVGKGNAGEKEGNGRRGERYNKQELLMLKKKKKRGTSYYTKQNGAAEARWAHDPEGPRTPYTDRR